MNLDVLVGIVICILVAISGVAYYFWQKKQQQQKFEEFLREKKQQDKVAKKTNGSAEMFQSNGGHGNVPIVKENTAAATTQSAPKPASWVSVKKYDSPPSIPTQPTNTLVKPKMEEEIITPVRDPNYVHSTTQKLPALQPGPPAQPSPIGSVVQATVINDTTKIDAENIDNNKKQVAPPEPFQILVADDSLVVRKALNDLLTKAGYATVMKKDGWEAFTHLNQDATKKPDLIITDIEMPQMNGFQLIENIRKHQNINDIPIVVISSHVDMHFKLLESGSIQGFIAKPFENDMLLGQVGYLLNANS